MVFSIAIFAVSLAMGLPLISSTDPLGSWRLSEPLHEASGWHEGVRSTGYEEDDQLIYRHDYSFRLPDGTWQRGHSYAPSEQLWFSPRPVEPGVGRAPDLVVEYTPSQPQNNRIRGTRTSAASPWVFYFMLLFVLSASLAVLISWGIARSKVRLLRHGLLARGAVTTCAYPVGEDTEDVPVAEYRRRLEEMAQRAAIHPLAVYARGFLFVWRSLIGVWLLSVFGLLIWGVYFVGKGIINDLLGNVAAQGVKQPPVLESVGFLLVWVAVSSFMLYGGRWLLRRSTRRLRAVGRPGSGDHDLRVDCKFEFRPPAGGVIRVGGSIPLAALANAEEPQPVFYNPDRPHEAMLLASFSPPLRVTERGDWQPTVGLWPYLRMALVTLALVGGLFCGLLFIDAWH